MYLGKANSSDVLAERLPPHPRPLPQGEGVKAPSPLAGEGWDEGATISYRKTGFTQKHLENPQLVPTLLVQVFTCLH